MLNQAGQTHFSLHKKGKNGLCLISNYNPSRCQMVVVNPAEFSV